MADIFSTKKPCLTQGNRAKSISFYFWRRKSRYISLKSWTNWTKIFVEKLWWSKTKSL